jgi:hypothetical protein
VEGKGFDSVDHDVGIKTITSKGRVYSRVVAIEGIGQ